jgi:hypothetical protein
MPRPTRWREMKGKTGKICNRIVKIDGQTARIFKAITHNRQVAVGKALVRSSDGVRRGVLQCAPCLSF